MTHSRLSERSLRSAVHGQQGLRGERISGIRSVVRGRQPAVFGLRSAVRVSHE